MALLPAGCGEEALPGPTPSASQTPGAWETPLPSLPAPTATARTAEFALGYYPGESLHPVLGSNETNLLLAPLVYEGLYELDGRFSPQPLLCESGQCSEDGLTWTFTLKRGVTFSDGSPLTADVAAASLRSAKGEGSLYRARLEGVTAVRSQGEDTLILELAYANGNLPALLDIPIFKEGDPYPLGTGPYAFRASGDELSLTLRGDWWQGKGTGVSKIPLRSLSGTDGLIYAFDAQDVSVVAQDPTGANPPYYSSAYETVERPTSVMLYVGYHAGKDRLCAQAEVRQAISRCLDRDGLCAETLLGRADPASLPMSPLCESYSTSIASTLAYDPGQVAPLLEEAGWRLEDGTWSKRREVLSLVFIVNADNSFKVAAAKRLTEDLTAAGIGVELKSLSWEEYVAALEAGEFDLYLGEVKLTADFDLTALLAPGGSLNYGEFEDQTLSAYLALLLASHASARGPAARQFFREFGRQEPFTPLCFKKQLLLVHDNLPWVPAPTQSNAFYGFFETQGGAAAPQDSSAP